MAYSLDDIFMVLCQELFINSKGGNIKYDYKNRREGEAQLFTK